MNEKQMKRIVEIIKNKNKTKDIKEKEAEVKLDSRDDKIASILTNFKKAFNTLNSK